MSEIKFDKTNILMIAAKGTDTFTTIIKDTINTNALVLRSLCDRVEELEKEIEVLKNERK